MAIYSFIDAILLRALPVADPQSLVALKWHSKAQPAVARSLNGDIVTDPRTGFTADGVPYAACEFLRSKIFSSVFAFTAAGRRNLVIGDAGGWPAGNTWGPHSRKSNPRGGGECARSVRSPGAQRAGWMSRPDRTGNTKSGCSASGCCIAHTIHLTEVGSGFAD